jgi:hypothetical protein
MAIAINIIQHMTSSYKKESFREKWGTRTILWIILFILIALFMVYVFVKESRDEEEYQKHINVEHNHPV